IEPLVGENKLLLILPSVVFPDPDTPTKAIVSPSAIFIFIFLRASTSSAVQLKFKFLIDTEPIVISFELLLEYSVGYSNISSANAIYRTATIISESTINTELT